jgi:diguanylate cyclase (GGDEF)-like protein
MTYWNIQFPLPLALALVATIGYLVGRNKRAGADIVAQQSRRELRRAQTVAKELERIAHMIRRHLTKHQASLHRFQEKVRKLKGNQREAAWQDLCQEAEEMLRPTLHLATQIAEAYDQIRQQGAHLMTFTELRTDPLTGICNRRAFDDALKTQFALMNRYDAPFSLAIFDIDHFKQINDEHGHLRGDRMLQQVAQHFDNAARETDIVARYGGEEFVVIMPHTELPGASIFSERLRKTLQESLPLTISGGVATAADGDTPESLLARADMALYGAKSAGRNLVFRHNGQQIESLQETPVALPAAVNQASPMEGQTVP